MLFIVEAVFAALISDWLNQSLRLPETNGGDAHTHVLRHITNIEQSGRTGSPHLPMATLLKVFATP